jgi:hypothetical protein
LALGNTLRPKQRDRIGPHTPAVVPADHVSYTDVHVAAFALSAGSAFGLVDMVREGKAQAIGHLFMTADGRLYFISAGVLGLAMGWVMRGREAR